MSGDKVKYPSMMILIIQLDSALSNLMSLLCFVLVQTTAKVPFGGSHAVTVGF